MARKAKQYTLSFRCFYEGSRNYTQHFQTMPLKDIEKWIDAYRYTHPALEAVSVIIWVRDGDRVENE